jgi:predicted RNA-binding protein YlqC (UPF0109 family)
MRSRQEESSTLSYSTSYNLRGPAFLKLLVGDKVAGSVIGRGGQVVHEYETKSGSQIKVSPAKTFFPATTERMIMLSGSIESIRAALPLIMLKLKEHGMDEGSLMLRMTVPNSCLIKIIGRGGETVRQIQSRTKSLIHLCEKVDGIPETALDIKGSESQVYDAAVEVTDIIQTEPKLKDIVGQYYGQWSPVNTPREREYPESREFGGHRDYDARGDYGGYKEQRGYDRQGAYDRYEEDQSPYQRYEPRQEYPRQPQQTYPIYEREPSRAEYQRYQPEPVMSLIPPPVAPRVSDPTTNPELLTYPMTIEFVVPPSAVPFILGENGSALKGYFDRTGAMVKVDPPKHDSQDINVSIQGPLCGVQAAHLLVIKQVTDAIMAEQMRY